MRLLICLNTLLVFPFFSIQAREFTSKDGKKINAELIAVRGDQAVIKRGIKQFTVPVDTFSLEDQEYFKKWKEEEKKNKIPKLNVEINSGKSDRLDKTDYFDDRKGSFQFEVKITNEEIGYDLTNAKAYLAVIGEDCDNNKRFGIMQKDNFNVSVLEGETFEWKGTEMRFKFDNRPPTYWGTEYYGYAFQLKNESGKVIFEKVMPARFDGHAEKILKLNVRSAFDSNLKDKGSLYIDNN